MSVKGCRKKETPQERETRNARSKKEIQSAILALRTASDEALEVLIFSVLESEKIHSHKKSSTKPCRSCMPVDVMREIIWKNGDPLAASNSDQPLLPGTH